MVRASSVVLRTAGSLLAGGALAWLAGLVLGEYPFEGDGIQWLAVMGGAGVGAVMAWLVNRLWAGAPPWWMAPVAAGLAGWGEVMAVQEQILNGMEAWPGEAWAAIAAAVGVAGYGVVTANRRARGQAR